MTTDPPATAASTRQQVEDFDAYVLRGAAHVIGQWWPRNPVAWAVSTWLRTAAALVDFRTQGAS